MTAKKLRWCHRRTGSNACSICLCLIASHISNSSIFKRAPREAKFLTRFRNRVYQIMGTLAVAGRAGGPSVSVGFPRESKETILDALRRAEGWGFGLAPRDKPGRHSQPQAKDGGIDVIGWPLGIAPTLTIYLVSWQLGSIGSINPHRTEYDQFHE